MTVHIKLIRREGPVELLRNSRVFISIEELQEYINTQTDTFPIHGQHTFRAEVVFNDDAHGLNFEFYGSHPSSEFFEPGKTNSFLQTLRYELRANSKCPWISNQEYKERSLKYYHLVNQMYLKKGTRVFWEDPDEDLSSGEYTIMNDVEVGVELVLISNGTSEAEVPPWEIRLLDILNKPTTYPDSPDSTSTHSVKMITPDQILRVEA